MPSADPTAVFGLVDSTSLLAEPERLRARAATDGVLFFRGFLPPEAVMAVRAEILQILDGEGWLLPHWSIEAPSVDRDTYEAAMAADGGNVHELNVTVDVYRRIQRLESFHSLAIHPRLLQLYATLFGEPVAPTQHRAGSGPDTR
jgi:hypothetical protein